LLEEKATYRIGWCRPWNWS